MAASRAGYASGNAIAGLTTEEAGRRLHEQGRNVLPRLAVDTSNLTGESVLIHPDVGEVLFSGSFVVEGDGEAEVTATGSHTRLAQIAELTRSGHRPTSPLGHELDRVVRVLSIAALGVGVVVFVVALVLGFSPHNGFLLAVGVALPPAEDELGRLIDHDGVVLRRRRADRTGGVGGRRLSKRWHARRAHDLPHPAGSRQGNHVQEVQRCTMTLRSRPHRRRRSVPCRCASRCMWPPTCRFRPQHRRWREKRSPPWSSTPTPWRSSPSVISQRPSPANAS